MQVGDEVFGAGSSVFAEFAVLDHWAPKPKAASFEEAAGYSMAAETASRVLAEVGVEPGQTLLISGASGGVGTAAIQFAASRGIRVIATASSENLDYLRSMGAEALPYGAGLVERVREVADSGVDAALDLAGSGVIDELIDLTGDPQKVLSIADSSAPSKGAKSTVVQSHYDDAYRELAELADQGKFTIPVARTFPLEETWQAQALSEAGHVRGRFIITI